MGFRRCVKPEIRVSESTALRVRGDARVREWRGLRDGFEVEREALGSRRGEYEHGYRRSENHSQRLARYSV
jgi:hypothetical protein